MEQHVHQNSICSFFSVNEWIQLSFYLYFYKSRFKHIQTVAATTER